MCYQSQAIIALAEHITAVGRVFLAKNIHVVLLFDPWIHPQGAKKDLSTFLIYHPLLTKKKFK